MATEEKVVYASAEEERKWNLLSNRMSEFHQHYKHEYKLIYESADGSFTKRRLTLNQYLNTIAAFNSHLTAHHTIEEHYVFPILAKGIPKFSHNYKDGHVKSHEAIHDGLEKLAKLVAKWLEDPTSYSSTDLKACLDSFSEVLFEHLDQEVEDIRGDKLKPHFKLEEILRIID
ncbi:hypothetical protein Hypma_002283 [Hypsizygus marmoreus]|uniref:Hemerythrin-like domain-containing protein n=1 Tax=Hypsizygus marmoreus TaxID=39966 RepID=A0A369JZN2_HYPMA|nr:hypothetical protein Hypma_002283 [Hypsizygus marmoreus]